MNLGNDSFSSGGQVLDTQTPTPTSTRSPQPPHQYREASLRPEEVAMYKSCCQEMYIKFGLPYAALIEVLASSFFKKQGTDQPPTKTLLSRGLRFVGNTFLGGFLVGSTVCLAKLGKMRREFLKNHPEFMREGIVRPERAQPLAPSKDLGYPAQMPNPDDLESSFTSDFSTTKLISDEPESVKTSKTTYEELRARNRSGNEGYTLEPEPPKLGPYSRTDEKPFFDDPPPPPPRKIVRRNKYGDEIE